MALCISCGRAASSQMEGVYLDMDNNEPNLHIGRKDDGSYDVKIGIFRLTEIDDGVGKAVKDRLEFSATDAAGNPIGGCISFVSDTAVVTFTSSTWEYIQNGDSFRYVRQAGDAGKLLN